jgi:hypothetical protein
MDVEQIIDSFLQFEYEYKMFSIEIAGIRIWHFIRFQIFYDLVKMFEIDTPFEPKGVKRNKFKRTFRDFFREKIVFNQFLAKKKDILILPNGRKFKDGDGYYRCIYTDLLDKSILQPHYLLDGRSAEGIYAKQRSKNVIYMDYDMFKRITRKEYIYKSIKKYEIEKNIFLPIEKYYNMRFNTELKRKWLKRINEITCEKRFFDDYYNYMLHRIKPKVIILTCYYNIQMMYLCEVAKKKRIPVIELQHGAIGRLHIAYNFHEKMKLPGFPDYIFTYGELDKVKPRFPIEDKRIIPVGFPELESNCNKYKKYRSFYKARKTILFVSQGLPEIAKYAEAMADILDSKKYRIIFKLHPKEFGEGKNIYGKRLIHSNIEVYEGYDKTIYEFLAKADWVVGCYSTVLYEATAFGIKIAVIKASRYKSMEDIYKNGYGILVDSEQKLAQEIMEDTFMVNPDISIFKKNAIENILNGISKVMKESHSRE